ncbi:MULTISPECIES: FecR family protein [Sphingobacterium]|uniref:FecR family protein n=1 Tax=Sphingobacterium TaxID=28453 RepID=UPI0013DAEB1A|nr:MULTISPECIES: FecR family protein [unclassified Sphingobacterium]
MTKDQLFRLFIAFRDGNISEEELHTLTKFVNQDAEDQWLDQLIDSFKDEESQQALSSLRSERMFDRIMRSVNESSVPVSHFKNFRLWYGTVAALLLLCFSLLFYSESKRTEESTDISGVVLPGSPKGNLLLDNGELIDLDKLNVDTTIVLEGYNVTKDRHGELSYTLTSTGPSDRVIYNTIVTPKGGEYKLCLPDGTYIWVNSSSQLKYPLNFGKERRVVELEGEAFFEVARLAIGQKYIPFIVKTRQQELEVLGTAFNINSYDPEIRTTLVEGTVRLRFDNIQQQLLKPNQQAIYNPHKDEVSVKPIDPFYTVAWRNGSFAFDNVNLYDVMATIARWYDVKVDYQGDFKEVYFSGTISRYADINKLLKLITLTGGVQFELKERRVSVMK